jgi:general secretion pathway protein D
LFFSVSGCTGLKPNPAASFGNEVLKVEVHKGGETRRKDVTVAKDENGKKTDAKELKHPVPVRLKAYDGKTDFRAGTVGAESMFSSKELVSVAVDNMKLSEFIKYIFSEIFDLDFVIDPSIGKNELEKPVTLSLQKEVTEDRLFSIIKDVLGQHKIIVSPRDGIYFLEKDTGKKKITLGMGGRAQDTPDVSGEISQFVPVEYADVKNLVAFLSQSGNVKVLLARGENTLVLTGAKNDVLRTMEMIKALDRPAMRGRFVGSSHLKYLDTDQGIEKLKLLLREDGVPVADQAGGNGVFLIPMENRGLLIYFAAQQKWISRIEYWIKVIDKPEKSEKKEYNVYFPKNCRASSLFESLKTLVLGDSDTGTRKTESKETKGKKSKDKTTGSQASSYSVRGDGIRLSVDENRNALIVYSVPEKYAMIADLIDKLDLMPVQVLIEASVMEITLTDKLQYGIEWAIKGKGGNSSHSIGTRKGLGLASGGLDFSLIADSKDFELAVNAMVKDDKVKILSCPRVTVRDGKSASIVVGTEVPVITSEALGADSITEGSSDTIRTIQYRTTGITLNVTPMVHSKGVVTLEISQEVSEAQANKTSEIVSPMILNRSISTEVVAMDGQTVLMGGLIKENRSDTVVKVPILGDIPFLGNLFKTTSLGGDRTELVIMITPHIIRTSYQIDEMRDLIFKSFKSIEIQ